MLFTRPAGCAGPQPIASCSYYPHSAPLQRRPGRHSCSRIVAMASSVEFAKYQGLGNDFVLVKRLFSCGTSYKRCYRVLVTLHVQILRWTTGTKRSCSSPQSRPCGFVTATLGLAAMGCALTGLTNIHFAASKHCAICACKRA